MYLKINSCVNLHQNCPAPQASHSGLKNRNMINTIFLEITWIIEYCKHKKGGIVAQAVRRSPPTAGVPSSRLGHSMWVSWWTKRGSGQVFLGVSPVFPYHKFHSTISPHSSHPFRFISSALVMVRHGRPAPLLFTDLQYRGFMASHSSTRPCVGHEQRIFYL